MKRGRRPARGSRARAESGGLRDRSFAAVLRPLIPSGGRDGRRDYEPLADLDYESELAIKREALGLFWRDRKLPGDPQRLLRSPRSRGYRTSSKRRVSWRRGLVTLSMSDRAAGRDRSVLRSALEPDEHGALYAALRSKLNEPSFATLARHLNYVIIRGSYSERVLILNVDEMNGALIRKAKLLADRLGGAPVDGVFVYLDPTGSDYFLESRRPDESVTFKRISGSDRIRVDFLERSYSYHPTSFSQVNESIVPKLLTRVRSLLAPDPSQNLLDLYCGYGLFSHFFAPAYRAVVGVEIEGPSVRSARANLRLNPSPKPVKFVAARIDREFVSSRLRRPSGPEVILLDPPRNGPLDNVVPALARRRPERVLHIFCDVDQIPRSLREWRSGGYEVRQVQALDMFPGAANLEVLVLMTPAAPTRGRHRPGS